MVVVTQQYIDASWFHDTRVEAALADTLHSPMLGGAIVLVQAMLILGLLIQRRQRARAQEALAGSLRFEQLVSETSTTLAVLSPAAVEAQLPQALLRIARELGFDRASLIEFTDDSGHASVARSVAVPGGAAAPATLAIERVPWTLAAVRRGEVVQWPALSYIPAAAAEDRTVFATLGTEGFACIPLTAGGRVVGALSLATVRRTAQWSQVLIQRSRLLGEVFAHVMVRRRHRPLVTHLDEQRKLVNVNEIILQIAPLLRADLEAKSIRLHLTLARFLPSVHADIIQLQHVILNVIANATDAMVGAATPRPTVTVATTHTDHGTVDIAIHDAGPGVGDDDLERIFEPFVTTKKMGLGMGLSISRSIIQAHGGRICATRNRDRGLTVHVELPSEEREKRP